MPDKKIEYELEPMTGISFARNCALNHAIDNHYDFLVFIDDDERAEPDWLVELFAEQQRNDLDIVGSPVWPMPVEGKLSLWHQFVWMGLKKMSHNAECKTRRKCENGAASTIKVATGSWMGRLDFFRSTGLKFDPYFSLTGGEDWHLWAEAKKLGAKTGWAPDATVYETVPLPRLTLSYHFRRSRDHEITKFTAAYKKNPAQTLAKLPSKMASRIWKMLVSVCFIPIKGAPSVLAAAMAMGGFVGQIQACMGRESAHYQHTTGY